MAIIDRTYFVGPLNIPNTEEESIQERLDYFIMKNEKQFLKDLLGYSLYKAFTEGLAAPVPDQKWKDLRDGVEYTNLRGRQDHWMGIAPPAVGDFKQSMIANHIYWHWMEDQVTQTVGLGEVATNAENSIPVSPAVKMIRANNEMMDWITEMICYLDANRDVYPEWIDQDLRELFRKYWYTNQFGI